MLMRNLFNESHVPKLFRYFEQAMNDLILWKNSHGFKCKYSRDMAWAVGSAPLLMPVNDVGFKVPSDEVCKGELDQLMPLLVRIDAGLDTHPKNRLLGIYFEQLIIEWLKNKPETEKIITNLQITKTNRTIGELDVLFRCNGIWNHWELAVKFYLGVGDTSQLENWIGPSVNDRLSTKLIRTAEVLNTARDFGAEELAAHGVINPVPSLWMKGRLFHHVNSNRRIPLNVNEHSEQFSWMHRSEALEVIEAGTIWLLGDKLDWLTAPRIKRNDAKLHTGRQIKQWLKSIRNDQRFCRLLYEYVDLGESFLTPINQVMITQDRWPD